MKTNLDNLTNEGMLDAMWADYQRYKLSMYFVKNKELVWRWWLMV